MSRILLLFFWFIFSSILPSPPAARGVFGVRIAFQANSEMTSFVCYLDNGRTITYQKRLTEREFVYYASGKWPSIYNPSRINYFEERNLGCGIYTDSFSYKETAYCLPIDSLWKIRFSAFPYRNSNELGWSSKLIKPSPKQEMYLYENYNVKNIDLDFFVDTSFWKLLSDVQDTTWIANYKSLR